jgi:hypothetical protein
VVFGLLDLLRDKAKGGHQRVRQDGGGRLGGEREHGVHCGCRIGAVMPADVRSSVEKFEQPGGAISRESRGGRRRGSRATYRCGRGEETARVNAY